MCRITSSEQYDILFKENDKLKWYPFVGKQYANSNVKVLIIGESHYASENKNVGWDSIEYLEKSKEYEDKNSTRYTIYESQDTHEWENATYNKIVKLISGIDYYPSTQILWENVAFYNFIQVLLPNRSIRPTTKQFEEGLCVFEYVVNKLEPDICLFIGVSSKGIFINNVKTYRFILYDKLSRVYPCSFHFKYNEKECQCLLIKHTSLPLLLQEWRIFLSKFSKVNQFCTYIKSLYLDSYSIDEKNIIFKSLMNRLEEKITIYSFCTDLKVEMTDNKPISWKIKLKDYDLYIAFEFWNMNYDRLTAGLYSEKGEMKKIFDKKEELKEKGWKLNVNWLYYEFKQAYVWRNREFQMIQNKKFDQIIYSAIESIFRFVEEESIFDSFKYSNSNMYF